MKSTQHFHAGFAPIAREVLYVSAPGAGSMDMAALPHRMVQRPLWPRVAAPARGLVHNQRRRTQCTQPPDQGHTVERNYPLIPNAVHASITPHRCCPVRGALSDHHTTPVCSTPAFEVSAQT